MNINAIKGTKVKENMPIGTHDVAFEKIEYRADAYGNVKNAFVHVEGYRSLYLPIFDGDNFQLDFLCKQLGAESWDDEEINQHKGTVITVHRFERENPLNPDNPFINTSFNADYNADNDEVAQLA